MKKKFAVAAATAALITASMSMTVFATAQGSDTPDAAKTKGDVATVSINHEPGGDTLSGTDAEDSADSFIQVKGKIYYVDEKLKLTEVSATATGVYGDIYVKDGKKVAANAIVTIDGKSYLVDGSSSKVKKTSDTIEKVSDFKVGNTLYTYIITGSGEIVKGWKAIGDEWFYAKPDGTVVEDTWVQTTPGRWFYVGTNGEMASGKNTTAVSGKATIAQLSSDDKTATVTETATGKIYVVDENGLWLNGWHYAKTGASTYAWHFYSDVKDGWVKYGNNWVKLTDYVAASDTVVGDYAFGKDCYMVTGLTKLTAGYVYANEKGVLQSGFQKIDGAEYYFPTGNSVAGAASQTKYIAAEGLNSNVGGRTFYTDATGKIIANQWYKNSASKWVYVDKAGKPTVNGPANINGSTYHFDASLMKEAGVYSVDTSSGSWTYSSTPIALQGKSDTEKAADLVNTIVIDNTGRQINNGWADLGDGDWAYAKDGKAYDGWLLYNGSWYYIDGGRMLTNQYVGNYFLNANGVWTSTR